MDGGTALGHRSHRRSSVGSEWDRLSRPRQAWGRPTDHRAHMSEPRGGRRRPAADGNRLRARGATRVFWLQDEHVDSTRARLVPGVVATAKERAIKYLGLVGSRHKAALGGGAPPRREQRCMHIALLVILESRRRRREPSHVRDTETAAEGGDGFDSGHHGARAQARARRVRREAHVEALDARRDQPQQRVPEPQGNLGGRSRRRGRQRQNGRR